MLRCAHVAARWSTNVAQPFPRTYATDLRPESIQVPSRSNGTIELDVYPPLVAGPSHTAASTVVIYLATGLPDSQLFSARDIAHLRRQLPCPIVNIKYRYASSSHSDAYSYYYPTPVHDVLAGYDWVSENLLPRRAITRQGRSERLGRIAVFGDLVGGSLATQLALTECRTGEPGIVAAAVHNPIVDWVALGAPQTHNHVELNGTTDLMVQGRHPEALQSLRASLFRKPGDWFDPFASPILFFRSAGASVPAQAISPSNDLDLLSQLQREDFFREQLALSAADSSSTETDGEPSTPSDAEQKRRKASRNFPSKTLGLQLPAFHITSSPVSPYREQAFELTNQLRKSVMRQSMRASSRFGRKVWLPEEKEQMEEDERADEEARVFEAERKIQSSLEDDTPVAANTNDEAANQRLQRVASWFRDVLG